MDLLGCERRMLEQAFTQMREVSVRVSCRCDALVHLHHVHTFPRNLFVGQGTQHLPGRVPATDRHDETASRRDSGSSLCSDQFRSLARDCVGIGKYFNLHGNSWQTAEKTSYASLHSIDCASTYSKSTPPLIDL